jgi:DNA topoisomerase-1
VSSHTPPPRATRANATAASKVVVLNHKAPDELPAHVAPESVETAKAAGLRYVMDNGPGITRVSRGKAQAYVDADGKTVRDPKVLGRIKRLAIPPAWTDVWICPLENGHIQATGRDARGRKQYRYHPEWQQVRDEGKYERMIAFGRALPKIRRRVAQDLRQPGLGRSKVLAAVIRLLETTLIRVGNEEYAKANRSFGLSTMRDRHVRIHKGKLHFEFRGKSGRNHEIDLHDPRLAAIVRQAQELPGQDLFQYLDEENQPQKISSDDVNGYLREIAGDEFSAKDFRTWAGTVLAAMALRQFEKFDTKAQAKKNLVQAIEAVAQRLGNTPSVCRKCYVHPVVLESYLAGSTVEMLRQKTEKSLRQDLTRLSAEEAAVMAFVQQRLKATALKSKANELGPALERSLKATRRNRRPGLRSRRPSAP